METVSPELAVGASANGGSFETWPKIAPKVIV